MKGMASQADYAEGLLYFSDIFSIHRPCIRGSIDSYLPSKRTIVGLFPVIFRNTRVKYA